MTDERRKDERKRFRMGDCAGDFFIVESNGKTYEASDVQDVSISGIGLTLSNPNFDVGEKIKLIYESEGLRITVAATIRWYSFISEEKGCKLGLQFDPNQGDMNLLIYMALREYYDNFDHQDYKEKIG